MFVTRQLIDFGREREMEARSLLNEMLEFIAHYDISSINKTEYLWSTRSNPEIKMHWGSFERLSSEPIMA